MLAKGGKIVGKLRQLDIVITANDHGIMLISVSSWLAILIGTRDSGIVAEPKFQ